MIIRLPMIDGYNTAPAEAAKMAEFISKELKFYSLVEVLTFHNFGESKYKEMGMTYEFVDQPNDSIDDLEEQVAILKASGLRIKIPKW